LVQHLDLENPVVVSASIPAGKASDEETPAAEAPKDAPAA